LIIKNMENVREPGFISSWNGGILEGWNSGFSKDTNHFMAGTQVVSATLQIPRQHLWTSGQTPIFQYSIIPIGSKSTISKYFLNDNQEGQIEGK
jgi:hypothetical protein